jgi:hypothetical protein
VELYSKYTDGANSNRLWDKFIGFTMVCGSTPQLPKYTLTINRNPSNGGTTTGQGTYDSGQVFTITATAASGFSFVN